MVSVFNLSCLCLCVCVCVCVCHVCEEDIDRIVATDVMTIQTSISIRIHYVCYATIHRAML